MSNTEHLLLVTQLAKKLVDTNQTLAVAESCTGGWVAKVLTDVAGSSAWFERGFVTYTNQAKHEMLGVEDSVLQEHGAVSQETVEAMAMGVLQNSHANFSLSISGIAGPSGGSVDKPVGLVWFAWCYQLNGDLVMDISSEKQNFSGDRNAIREQAVEFALKGLLKIL